VTESEDRSDPQIVTETSRQSLSVTWGLRYHEGYFHIYLMWMEWKPPRHWLANRTMVRKRYKTLDRAIKALRSANGVDSVVMIFPV